MGEGRGAGFIVEKAVSYAAHKAECDMALLGADCASIFEFGYMELSGIG